MQVHAWCTGWPRECTADFYQSVQHKSGAKGPHQHFEWNGIDHWHRLPIHGGNLIIKIVTFIISWLPFPIGTKTWRLLILDPNFLNCTQLETLIERCRRVLLIRKGRHQKQGSWSRLSFVVKTFNCVVLLGLDYLCFTSINKPTCDKGYSIQSHGEGGGGSGKNR